MRSPISPDSYDKICGKMESQAISENYKDVYDTCLWENVCDGVSHHEITA